MKTLVENAVKLGLRRVLALDSPPKASISSKISKTPVFIVVHRLAEFQQN